MRGDAVARHHPRRRFGQHFLEPAWVTRLIEAVDVGRGQTFLEIGPGRGALTLPLAERAGQVIGIEVDRDLAAALTAEAPPNVHIVQGDVLNVDLAATIAAYWQGGSPLRLVGNLPYNITSPTLARLIAAYTAGLPIRDATLMLQREVADRLLAAPGSHDYGRLTVLVGLHADVSLLLRLPPGAFRPRPAVHSALVRLTFHPSSVQIRDQAAFDRFVRDLFTHRRKTLASGLRSRAAAAGLEVTGLLAAAGLDPRRRPGTLDLAELARLQEVFAAAAPGPVL